MRALSWEGSGGVRSHIHLTTFPINTSGFAQARGPRPAGIGPSQVPPAWHPAFRCWWGDSPHYRFFCHQRALRQLPSVARKPARIQGMRDETKGGTSLEKAGENTIGQKSQTAKRHSRAKTQPRATANKQTKNRKVSSPARGSAC